tara:strand:- start:310 stop:1239 length:930 start_codon:yes stop_codon:yes gene_type:complete
LLGFAIPINFEFSNLVYINYINKNDETTISRYNFKSKEEEILIQFKQPYSNHNGGMMAFGPEGYLYIGVGDGGNSGDPNNYAQNINNYFGSLLRIDISVDKGYIIPKSNPFINKNNAKPEIWSYGLRNPWRFSFDRLTGDLYIGDVGQNSWEEINFQNATSSGGENYGWNYYEGLEKFNNNEPNNKPNKTTKPIYTYSNDANVYKVILGINEIDVSGCSITGGYVYRGSKIPSLYGHYIFSDYCTGKIWSFKYESNQLNSFLDLTDMINIENGEKTIYVSSLGEDADGELYFVDYNGNIFKMINPKIKE